MHQRPLATPAVGPRRTTAVHGRTTTVHGWTTSVHGRPHVVLGTEATR